MTGIVAGGPAPGLDDELARLRRRAYGPDADIEKDPEALRRLHELEGSRTVAQDDAVAEPVEPSPSESSTDPGTDLAAGGDSPSARPRTWRLIAFSASLAAAAFVACGVGLTIPDAVAPGADATLQPIEVEDARGARALMDRSFDLDLGAPIVYESFDDLEVLSASNEAGLTCLLVSWTNHWSDFSCTPDGLVPVVDYEAYLGSPILLDDPLPPGSVIRFELRGGVVEVTMGEPPEGRVNALAPQPLVASANASRPSAA